MYIIMLFVLASAVFTFCGATIIPVRSGGCEGLLQCNASAVAVFKGKNVADVMGLMSEDRYNQVCESNDRFQLCVANSLDGCQDPNTLSAFLSQTEIMYYFCSSEKRKILEDTPCFADQGAQLAAQQGVDACMSTFQLDIETELYDSLVNNVDPDSTKICPFVDQLRNCVNETLTTSCGQDFTSFYTIVWKMNFRPAARKLGCWTNTYLLDTDVTSDGGTTEITRRWF